MSADENKAIFLRFVNELKKGNLGVIDEVCSPSFTYYSPSDPGWPRGLEGARKLVTRVTSADLQSTIEEQLTAATRAAPRGYRWENNGARRGVQAAGSRGTAPNSN